LFEKNQIPVVLDHINSTICVIPKGTLFQLQHDFQVGFAYVPGRSIFCSAIHEYDRIKKFKDNVKNVCSRMEEKQTMDFVR
jgi:hypothetical protein